MTARAAVLGSPIGHSLSPVLHNAAYAELGLTGWSYEAVECSENAFPAWFSDLGPDWRGLSLTMPLKRVVIGLLDRVSPLAGIVGAVNTVTWDDARRTVGDNTDVHGIVAALRSIGVESARTACIIGAGATAASAVAALAELGCRQIQVQARSAERAVEALGVAHRVGVEATVTNLDDPQPALGSDVVIATLPAAAAAAWAARLPLAGSAKPAGVLLDVTYHPWPTAAASIWTDAGGTAVGGFEMLLHQAAAQFTLMTGDSAPLAAMRTAGQTALTHPQPLS